MNASDTSNTPPEPPPDPSDESITPPEPPVDPSDTSDTPPEPPVESSTNGESESSESDSSQVSSSTTSSGSSKTSASSHSSGISSSSSTDYCGPDITDWLVAACDTGRTSHKAAFLRELLSVTLFEMIFEDGAGFLNEILARKLFVELVGGGDWDLSNYLKFSGRCPSAKCKKTVTLCGRCYDGSVATNLFYAYVGRVCGFSEAELNIGGHVAELFAHLQGDTEQDKASIQVGFCIFNQTGVDGVVTRQILCGCVSQKGDAALASNLPREGIQNCKPGSHVWTTNKELPE